MEPFTDSNPEEEQILYETKNFIWSNYENNIFLTV